MEIKISKNFIRTSPDKIRPIVNLVRGWKIVEALNELKFLNKHASYAVIEILNSSLAAAKDKDMNEDDLFIKLIKCDEGPRLKRRRILHRGRASAINKRMSHIELIISDEKKAKNNTKKLENKNIVKSENKKEQKHRSENGSKS